MRQFYDITTKLKDTLEAHSQVSVVTTGDIFDIDLNKQTIFPLSHIIVNQATFEGQIVRMNVSIVCMDLVDETKENPRSQAEPFYGTSNEQNILNTQLAVINDVVTELRRGTLYTDLYQLDGTASCVPFSERFENLLAGWTATFDVLLANTEISIC